MRARILPPSRLQRFFDALLAFRTRDSYLIGWVRRRAAP
jgi:hypothetical protein